MLLENENGDRDRTLTNDPYHQTHCKSLNYDERLDG